MRSVVDHQTDEGRMGGRPPLERQWAILRALTSRRYGLTLRELADEHGVSLKTIRRDLNVLRRAGFRLTERDEAHGSKRWMAEADPAAPPLSFDISELLALWVSRSLVQPLAGTLFWDALQSALRKVRSTLSESSARYVDNLAGVLHQTSFRTSRYHHHSQLIDDLMVAIEDRRSTFLTYQSARSTEPLSYPVHPYGLVSHRNSLYLVARSEQHDELRTFKVDRITDVHLEPLKFDKPADFNLQSYLTHTLGIFHDDAPPQRIVIRFAPTVARYILEHHWHHSQTLTPHPDGSLLAEFHLAALEEIKSWILSFGAKAVVEEPEELRQTIRQELEAMSDASQVRLFRRNRFTCRARLARPTRRCRQFPAMQLTRLPAGTRLGRLGRTLTTRSRSSPYGCSMSSRIAHGWVISNGCRGNGRRTSRRCRGRSAIGMSTSRTARKSRVQR